MKVAELWFNTRGLEPTQAEYWFELLVFAWGLFVVCLGFACRSLVVVPSRQDNLPNTGGAAVEAQACDMPVVAFNIGGLLGGAEGAGVILDTHTLAVDGS